MLMPKRSGQELQRYIQDLKTAGFSHVVEGHLDFEMAWQDYLGILAVLGVDRPSHGTPSSQAVRSFFLRRDQIDRAAISPEALAATVDIHEEGAASQVTRNLRERDRVARERCIAIYRARHQGRIICLACKIDFGKRYGPLGEGYIHIHHLNPLAEAKGPRLVSPEIDLVPLCPNCHAMVHQTRPPLTIARLVELLEE